MKVVIQCSWDDVPHLSHEAKEEMRGQYPLHERDARTKGIPAIGSGAVWPVIAENFSIDHFAIPDHFARGYALDVGWNNTAALWGAHDRETDILYIYDEYKSAHAEPVVHAANIKAKGEWIKGAIDPASRGRAQADGRQLKKLYKDAGLKLVLANNELEAGILEVYDRLSQGRIKVFSHLDKFFKEHQFYRRDKHGKIVKLNDHLMDCLRYLVMTMGKVMRTRPAPRKAIHSAGTIIADTGVGY